MESSTQTGPILGYLSLAELPVRKSQYVNNNAQKSISDRISFIQFDDHLSTQALPKVIDVILKNEDEEEEENGKIRERHPENWRQTIRKFNKNRGLEYIKVNGEVSSKKQIGPPCTCKAKCFLRIGPEACFKIFSNFWKLGDYALQNAYIGGCVRIVLPKYAAKNMVKGKTPSRRFYTRLFYVNVNGVDTDVCKQAFLNLHSISNGRLDRLLKKKQEMGNTGTDERGRHNNKINKIPIDKIREVRKSIDEYRKRSGFLGRRKSKIVETLPASLTIRAMYRKYREEMLAKNQEPVCEFRYRKIFHADFNLDFARTCQLQQPATTTTKPQQTQTCPPQIQVTLPLQTQQLQQPVAAAKRDLVEIATLEFDDKPVYTTLETKNGSSTYLTLSQDLYQGYNMQTHGWIFPAQS